MLDAVAVPQLREPDNLAIRDEADQRQDEDEEERSMHCNSSTAASRARRRMCASSKSLCNGSLSAGVEVAQMEWRVGHRVRVRAAAAGRAPKAAVVLSVLAAESGNLRYKLLFDDEATSTVDACQLLGAPATPTTLLRLQAGQRPKGVQAEKGLFARTAEPDEQRLQVLSIVNEMTQDLAVVMQNKSSKSNKVSLEEAMRLVHGAESISDDSASALEGRVGLAKASCNVVEVQHAPPCEPLDILQEAFLDVGRCAARLIPEDRLVAQRLVSVGLEMLVSGGSVMPTHISDQLGPFVGLQEANSLKRLPNRGDEELEAWRKLVSQPLESLLNFFFKKGLLEGQRMVDGETYQALQEAIPCLAAVWRYVDPASNRCGFEDALRRAVNRFQRTRPSLTMLGAPSRSLDAESPCGNASSSTERRSLPMLSLPAPSDAGLRSASSATLRSPSLSSRRSSRETARRSASGTRLGSRPSTPGSIASIGGLPALRFSSGASNCSTSPSDSQRDPLAQTSIFSATGSRLILPKP